MLWDWKPPSVSQPVRTDSVGPVLITRVVDSQISPVGLTDHRLVSLELMLGPNNVK